jgi:hypothetical protein
MKSLLKFSKNKTCSKYICKTTVGKVSLLESLKSKYGDQYLIEEIKEAEALNIEKLTSLLESVCKKMDDTTKNILRQILLNLPN